ncbi:MAG TPA: hypothetical protein VD971_08970 [Phycisphaerales bacterium]|nr:hypothetical protein [Phycisphaerales bacterium]
METTAAPAKGRKGLRIALVVVGVLAALLAAGVLIFGASGLNSLVKRIVERVGSDATGVRTTLGSARMDLAGGAASLNNLRVANPPGFTSDNFLTLDSTDVALDVSSVTSDTIVVSHVKLSGITVNLEGSIGNMNYRPILDNLSKGKGDSSAPPKKFLIRTIEITDINANVTVAPLGTVPVRVARLEVTDLGSEGLTAGEITQLVLQATLEAVASAGAGVLPPDLLGDLSGQLDKLRDLGLEGFNTVRNELRSIMDGKVRDALDKARSGVEDTAKDVRDAASGAVDKLFGGQRKKDPK